MSEELTLEQWKARCNDISDLYNKIKTINRQLEIELEDMTDKVEKLEEERKLLAKYFLNQAIREQREGDDDE